MLLSAEGVYKLFFCSRGAIFLFASDVFIFIRLSRFLSFNMWTSSHVGNENVGRKEREKDIKRKYARRKRQKKKNATFMQNRKLSVQLKEIEQVNVKTKRPGGFQTLPFRRMCFCLKRKPREKKEWKVPGRFYTGPSFLYAQVSHTRPNEVLSCTQKFRRVSFSSTFLPFRFHFFHNPCNEILLMSVRLYWCGFF